MKTAMLAMSVALMTATGAFAQDATADTSATAAQTTQGEFGEILLAQAQTEAQVIAALELQGYEITNTRRSLLGRVMITAENDVHVREVVMSRATGEILSDQIISLRGDATQTAEAEAETGTESGSSDSSISLGTSGNLDISLGGSSGSDDDDDDRSSGISVGGSGGASVSIGLGN